MLGALTLLVIHIPWLCLGTVGVCGDKRTNYLLYAKLLFELSRKGMKSLTHKLETFVFYANICMAWDFVPGIKPLPIWGLQEKVLSKKSESLD